MRAAGVAPAFPGWEPGVLLLNDARLLRVDLEDLPIHFARVMDWAITVLLLDEHQAECCEEISQLRRVFVLDDEYVLRDPRHIQPVGVAPTRPFRATGLQPVPALYWSTSGRNAGGGNCTLIL